MKDNIYIIASCDDIIFLVYVLRLVRLVVDGSY